MTVRHLLLLQFKADASAEAIDDVCQQLVNLKDNVIHPTSQKPFVKSFTGGKDNSVSGRQNGFTHGFLAEFETIEDRNTYQNDPVHHAVVNNVIAILEKATVIDFTPGEF